MRDDPAQDEPHRRTDRSPIFPEDRHHGRQQREDQHHVEAENQRGRRGSRPPESRQRQGGTHIADVGISADQTLQRGDAHAGAGQRPADENGDCEGEEGRRGRGKRKGATHQLFEGRPGQDVEEQCRQGDVNQIEVEPRKAGARKAGELSCQKADEDDAEKR